MQPPSQDPDYVRWLQTTLALQAAWARASWNAWASWNPWLVAASLPVSPKASLQPPAVRVRLALQKLN